MGSEVLEMLVKFMDNVPTTDFVVVLAGYRNLMTKMLNANLNLMSRMGNWIDFPDYDDAELLQISELLADNYQYAYPQEAKDEFVKFMNLRKEFPYFSNARTVRNAMERARRISATRVLKDALDNGASTPWKRSKPSRLLTSPLWLTSSFLLTEALCFLKRSACTSWTGLLGNPYF